MTLRGPSYALPKEDRLVVIKGVCSHASDSSPSFPLIMAVRLLDDAIYFLHRLIVVTGKDKQTPQGFARTTSAVDLGEFCEKHYEKLLPIMADKYEYELRKKEKLEEVKVQLYFGGTRKK
ncbi:hypothetical protein Tco_1272349 [Tanacetum coccineum]